MLHPAFAKARRLDEEDIDGRFKRAISTFKSQIAEEICPAFAELVDFSDCRLSTATTKADKAELATCVASKVKAATKHGKLLLSVINKIASSKVATYLADDIASLEKQQAVTRACAGILSLMAANTNPNPGEFIEHVGILRECVEAKVSANLELMVLQQEIQ